MEMDGRRASFMARDYFETIHGAFGVIAFRIEGVTFDDVSQTWAVQCSFFSSLTESSTGPSARLYYEVVISEEGNISQVRKLAPTTESP